MEEEFQSEKKELKEKVAVLEQVQWYITFHDHHMA
jgi:hypothetical protein